MKKVARVLVVLSLITTGILFSPKKSVAQDVVDVQVFYDQLSPYGTWVSDPTYGYVWVPQADPDFTPYGTAGHWEWTDDGWLWVSDYPWGWAPFHYGRWNYDNNYGWMWVPGRTWGPAWVSWRSCPGYYGWCPLGPGIGVNGYANFNPPANRWVFVQDKYINSPRVTQYYERRDNNANIYGRTTIINNRQVDNARHTTYFTGPRREDVQKVTGAQIKPVAIRDNAKPGQAAGNGEVSIYRPAIQKTAANTARKPAPQKVAAVRDLKPIPGGHAQETLSHQRNKTAATPNKTASHPVAPKASTSQQSQHNNPRVNNAQPQKQPQQQGATPNANKTQQHKQPQHAAPRSNNTRPQKQVQHNKAPKPQTAQHAPKPQPAQQAPKLQPAPHQNNTPRPAPQPRAQPAPRPQPASQARPAEQPHPQQEQPQQEESRPR